MTEQIRSPVTEQQWRRLGLETDGQYIMTTGGLQWDGTFEGDVVPWSPWGLPDDQMWIQTTHHMMCRRVTSVTIEKDNGVWVWVVTFEKAK